MKKEWIVQQGRWLAEWSEKNHFIQMVLFLVPALIGIAWILFPVMDHWNISYRSWHLACGIGIVFSGYGIGCWITEKIWGTKSPSFLSFIILGGFSVGCLVFLALGDFYWAFTRGYFLD